MKQRNKTKMKKKKNSFGNALAVAGEELNSPKARTNKLCLVEICRFTDRNNSLKREFGIQRIWLTLNTYTLHFRGGGGGGGGDTLQLFEWDPYPIPDQLQLPFVTLI